MLKKPEISIIICTHNRASILDESLSKYQALREMDKSEILVILNACSDHSLQVVEKHAKQLPQLRWVDEPALGHSNARNKGWNEALADFVFYIDDDAYPDVNLIAKLSALLSSNKIECISGRTLFWDKGAAPWIRGEMVETPEFRSNFGPMPKGGYINGCACGFQKLSLREIGGFAQDLGMSGKELGYYDEVFVQHKLEDKDTVIYFDPSLIVFHRSHQSTALEFLTAALVKGRSMKRYSKIYARGGNLAMRSLLKLPILFIQSLLSLPVNVLHFGFRAGVVLSFNEFFFHLGRAV